MALNLVCGDYKIW